MKNIYTITDMRTMQYARVVACNEDEALSILSATSKVAVTGKMKAPADAKSEVLYSGITNEPPLLHEGPEWLHKFFG